MKTQIIAGTIALALVVAPMASFAKGGGGGGGGGGGHGGSASGASATGSAGSSAGSSGSGKSGGSGVMSQGNTSQMGAALTSSLKASDKSTNNTTLKPQKK